MHKDLTYTINGALFKVYNALGNVWREEAYENAMELELCARGINVERQKEFQIFYFRWNVGNYRVDLLVDDKVILELKAVPKILSLHRAQLISYLKGFDKPLGILANFGGLSLDHATYPNSLELNTPLRDDFDFGKIQIEGKEDIKDLLLIANRILVHLGPGYFHQVYRRAFFHELKTARADFNTIKDVFAKYQNRTIDTKEVNFFGIGDLLLAVVAVKELDEIVLSKFRNYINYLDFKRGLILNFNSIRLDFRYFRLGKV